MTLEATPGHTPTGAKVYADARGQWSWALFDWANQPFFTVITTFIFAPYLANEVFLDKDEGTALLGYTHAIIGISVAILSILLGPIADYSGRRKPWIFVMSLFCVIGSWMLYWATPGADYSTILFVLFGLSIATIGIEVAIMFNHSMLPTLVPDRQMGRLSGNGWALGYVGGMIMLIFVLVALSGMTGTPIIPLDAESGEPNRITGPLAAVWLLVFIIPMMLWTPDTKSTGLSLGKAASKGLSELATTIGHVSHYKNIFRFLIARMLYADGVNAIIAFGGVYAAGALDWGLTQLGVFGIILNVFAIFGSLWGGYMDDKKSSKFVINVSVIGLAIGAIGILSVTKTSILFFIPVEWVSNGYHPMFSTPAEQMVLLFAMLIGFCLGPAQSASRTLMARMTPEKHEAQFFGLYALVGKATSWMAPLLIGVITMAFSSQRAGIGVTVLFLIAGLVLLQAVREVRSVAVGNLPHNDGTDGTPHSLSHDQMNLK